MLTSCMKWPCCDTPDKARLISNDEGFLLCPLCSCSYGPQRNVHTKTAEDIIIQFVDDFNFDVLIAWADILGVEHEEKVWAKDTWTEEEVKLRDTISEAMLSVGRDNATS